MKIALLSENRAELDALRNQLTSAGAPDTVLAFDGGAERLASVVEQARPDLVFVAGGARGSTQLVHVEQVGGRNPRLGIILLVADADRSPDFLMNAMRAGVREILPLPVSPAELQEALERARLRMVAIHAPGPRGKILAFVACKGGSGASFLATNLAYALAAARGKKVILIDLALQLGGAELYVSDQRPTTNLGDLAKGIDRLDGTLLSASVIRVLPGFSILAAPEEPEKAIDVRPEHIEAIVNTAASLHDFVVLDVGGSINSLTVKAFDMADYVFPVLQETLPFIRNAKRLLNVFRRLGYSPDKVRLIVNRYERSGEITLSDIERTLGSKVFLTCPNSFATVAESVNQGVPITEISKKDPVSRSLEQFAETLSGGTNGKTGWLKGLLGRGKPE